MENLNNDIPRVLLPQQAAVVMGTNAQRVRVRMQRNIFDPPIGTAYRGTGNRYNYDIYPEKLAKYLDISVDEVYRRLSLCTSA